jgi:hypothetical protein
MLRRLLLVVLALVGPLPFRVCTCAATQATFATWNGERSQRTETRCSCGHHHDPEGVGQDEVNTVIPRATGATAPPGHQPDCPTAQVRHAIDAAVPTEVHCATQDSARESVATACDVLFSTRHGGVPLAKAKGAPACPLYITHLTLRN